MSRRTTAMLAIFVGPAVCAADQLASYALVHRAATNDGNSAIVACNVAAAGIILVGLALAWRVLASRDETPRDDGVGGVVPFLGVVGIATNLFFLLVVVVGFGLPQWFLRPVD
jgi:hypothetical protein